MMLAGFRRSRLLAAFLLAASPAAGGTLLPAIHPCPVDTPWLVGPGAHSGHMGHSMADGHAPAADQHHAVCHCIGGCLAGAATLSPAVTIADARIVVRPAVAAWASHDASLHLAPLAALLPPSTAPPQG